MLFSVCIKRYIIMPNIQSEIPSDLSPYTQSAHSCLHVFVYAVLFTWIIFSIPFICKSSPFLISSFSSFFFSMSTSSFSPFFPSLPNNHKTPMIIKSWLAINDYLKESHKAIIHAINRSYLNDLSFEFFFYFTISCLKNLYWNCWRPEIALRYWINDV